MDIVFEIALKQHIILAFETSSSLQTKYEQNDNARIFGFNAKDNVPEKPFLLQHCTQKIKLPGSRGVRAETGESGQRQGSRGRVLETLPRSPLPLPSTFVC